MNTFSIVKVSAFVAALLVAPLSFAESKAQRESDATPVTEYGVPVSQALKDLPATASGAHPHPEGNENEPHARDHRWNQERSTHSEGYALPYGSNDYSGRTAVENRREFFGDN